MPAWTPGRMNRTDTGAEVGANGGPAGDASLDGMLRLDSGRDAADASDHDTLDDASSPSVG